MSDWRTTLPPQDFDAWERALGAVPHIVTRQDHVQGAWLDKALGDVVLTNQRYVTVDGGLMVKGIACYRGKA
jgi:hypothetical protein